MKFFNLIKLFEIAFFLYANSCFSMIYVDGKIVSGRDLACINSSGKIIKKTHAIVDGLSEIKVSCGTLIISQIDLGDQDELVIETDKNIYSYVDVSCKKNCLRLNLNKNRTIKKDAILKYHLKIKMIDCIKTSGDCEIEFCGPFNAQMLTIKFAGTGHFSAKKMAATDLKLEISGDAQFNISSLSNCDRLKINILGNGSIDFGSGTAKEQKFGISGMGKIDSQKLKGNVGTVIISGTGSANVNLDEKLNVQAPAERCVVNYGSAIPSFEQYASK